MSVGIRTIFGLSAALVLTSDQVLGASGLASPIAASQTQKIKCWLPFSVGATGGIQVQLVVPAGGTLFNASFRINNPVTPSTIIAVQVASAAFAAALAVAGTHWMEIEAEIVNGLTAGNVDLQIAQNTSDVLSLTLLRGAVMEATTI
mgnify:CR=1 FL=1